MTWTEKSNSNTRTSPMLKYIGTTLSSSGGMLCQSNLFQSRRYSPMTAVTSPLRCDGETLHCGGGGALQPRVPRRRGRPPPPHPARVGRATLAAHGAVAGAVWQRADHPSRLPPPPYHFPVPPASPSIATAVRRDGRPRCLTRPAFSSPHPLL